MTAPRIARGHRGPTGGRNSASQDSLDAASDALQSLYAHLDPHAQAEQFLEQVCKHAVDLIADADMAGITIGGSDTTFRTVAATHQLVRTVDSIQFRLDYGPSVTSSRTGTVVRAHASEAHSRWPQFASAAKAVGAVSFLSMPLPGRERPLGTLNLYSHDLRGFTGADVALLQLFAVTSAYALHSSQRLDIARKHAMDLERALESRGVIEQAKGIIMGTHHVDADRAFRILIQDSQRSNVKLRVIAQQYIDGAIDPRQATNKPETN